MILGLIKSLVSAHTRTSKTGKVSMIQDYTDSRTRKEREVHTRISTQLKGLPLSLQNKCRRAAPNKGEEITLLKTEAVVPENVLQEYPDIAEEFHKAHVSAYTRTHQGHVSVVREHDDSRRPSEAAQHFQTETHRQSGGGYRVARLSTAEMIAITKRGLEAVGLHQAAKEVTEKNLAGSIEWVIHHFGMKGVTVDLRTREAKHDPAMKAAASKVISLFEQVKDQLRHAA